MKTSLLKSTIFHQLTGAAIALTLVCLFSFINPLEKPGTLPGGGQEPGGGKSITAETGKEMIANFPKWQASSGQMGGYLSKTILDTLFATHPTATGIYWYMGSDAAGATFNLIVEPGTSRLNGVNLNVSSSIFVSETMCPTECGSLAK